MRARLLVGARVWMQAELAWSILSVLVMYAKHNPGFPQTVTYGELAKLMGYDKPGAAHTLSRPLALIGDLCLKSDLPPLNVMVVSRRPRHQARRCCCGRGQRWKLTRRRLWK